MPYQNAVIRHVSIGAVKDVQHFVIRQPVVPAAQELTERMSLSAFFEGLLVLLWSGAVVADAFYRIQLTEQKRIGR
jgi:hypothetical protein